MENLRLDYYLYARKSSETEDRQVLSIDSQIKELGDIAKNNNLNILEKRTEAKSAKAPGRDVFNNTLNDIEAGKAQGLIVWHPDRLSRNSVDTGRLIYLFDLNKLQEVVTPGQIFRNTPNDKFLLSLLCSQAKLDNDNKSINVKRGLRAKCDRGIYPCPAPTGYLNDKYAKSGFKQLIQDPDRYDLVKKMFSLVLTQRFTPVQILRIANDQWQFRMKDGRKMARNTIYHILSNPVYAGIFEYPSKSGNWYNGIHSAMITQEEYDMVQAILGSKGRPRPKKHIFKYTGLMHCGECKALITCEEKIKRQKNGNVHRYIYYRCTKRMNPNCSQGYVEEDELEKQIMRAISTIEIPSEFNEWAMKWLRNQNIIESENRSLILTKQQSAYNDCLKKLDGLIDMRAGKEITENEYMMKKSILMKEKKRYEELLQDTQQNADKWLQKADEAFTFAETAMQEFKDGNFYKKRAIFTRLGSDLIIKDKSLRVDYEKTLIPLIPISKEVKQIHERFGPVDSTDRKLQIAKIYSQNPCLLGRMDSNHDSQIQSLMSYHWTTPQRHSRESILPKIKAKSLSYAFFFCARYSLRKFFSSGFRKVL